MSARTLDEARLLLRLREMRLTAAQARLAEERRAAALAAAAHAAAERNAALAARQGRLADRPDQAEARLLLLACAQGDQVLAQAARVASAETLVQRRATENEARGRVIAAEARRHALEARQAVLHRAETSRADERVAIEQEEARRA